MDLLEATEAAGAWDDGPAGRPRGNQVNMRLGQITSARGSRKPQLALRVSFLARRLRRPLHSCHH